MPIQKTFTIVPALSRDASPAPAFAGSRMTSKQVKEAYKTATKGPTMSRAERMKMERAEQQRIRKEMEKEKSAARARLLRDKKKEKELAEREVKRREGKPLVTVRPSQDTIARFVRGNGSNRKRDCLGSMVNQPRPCLSNPEPDVPPTEGSSVAKGTMNSILETSVCEGCEEISETTKDAAHTKDHETAPCGPNAIGVDSRLGSATRPDHLPKFETRASSKSRGLASEQIQEAPDEETLAAILDSDLDTNLSQNSTSRPQAQRPSQLQNQLPQIKQEDLDALLCEELDFDILDGLDGLDGTKGVSEALIPPTNRPQTTPGRSQIGPQAGEHNMPRVPENRSRRIEVEQNSPPSGELLAVPCGNKISSWPVPQVPPFSTQAIMLNLDDYFPTSSQQARELDQERDDFDSLLESLTPSQAMPPPPAPALGATPTRATSQRAATPKARATSAQEPLSSGEGIPHTNLASSVCSGPKTWFTASGSKELESLALQRSRRTAALEEIQQRERRRAQGWLEGAEAGAPSLHPAPAQRSSDTMLQEQSSKRRCLSSPVGKENIPPDASQETDYDGGWVEDFEW